MKFILLLSLLLLSTLATAQSFVDADYGDPTYASNAALMSNGDVFFYNGNLQRWAFRENIFSSSGHASADTFICLSRWYDGSSLSAITVGGDYYICTNGTWHYECNVFIATNRPAQAPIASLNHTGNVLDNLLLANGDLYQRVPTASPPLYTWVYYGNILTDAGVVGNGNSSLSDIKARYR